MGTPAAVVPQPPPGDPSGNGWPTFVPSASFQLRRLTSDQYVASVKSLLGVSVAGMPPIEPVSKVSGSTAIGASSAIVSSAGVGQFETAALFLAHAAFLVPASRQKIVPCTPTGLNDTVCFRSFVSAFGQRAFRRPLSPEEVDRYAALAATAATSTNDVWQGLEVTVTAFLQSPNFLYLAEVGEPDPQTPGRARYTGFEMASRLSYFLTNNTPDDELLTVAASGSLVTPEGVRLQAQRLLGTAGAHDALRTFFTDLLALEGLDTLNRPVQAFPGSSPTLGAALKEQALLTLEDLVFTRNADYREAFDQPATFVNAELATFYGLTALSGSGFARVSLPVGSPRAGLLGQAGVLAVHDHADGTSPTKRGLFVLTRLLCQDLALAPPANLVIPPPPTGMLTARQRLEQHAQIANCASCHRQMDSVGLSLEHFDALGVYRDTDRGMAIDDSGELSGGKYKGEAGLGALIHRHPALQPCLTQELYGVSVGHIPTEFDRQTFGSLVGAFDSSGARLLALLSAITASDGFRFVPN